MNTLDLQGRVAIITGGAQGIGLAVAQRMRKSGATVVLWDLDPSLLKEARKALEADPALAAKGDAPRVLTATLDVTDATQVAAAAVDARAQCGRIDILVNNAGITGGNGLTWELDPAVWKRVMDVNVIGPYMCCRAVIPYMLERGYGRIVNVASIAGKEGNPNASHYSASKAALIGLTKSLCKELAESGVVVNAVTPAAVRTRLFDSMTEEHIGFMLSKIPMKRFLQAEELASMVCWLSTEECSFSTGAVFDISGGRATY